jgi:hypothetical protein
LCFVDDLYEGDNFAKNTHDLWTDTLHQHIHTLEIDDVQEVGEYCFRELERIPVSAEQ